MATSWLAVNGDVIKSMKAFPSALRIRNNRETFADNKPRMLENKHALDHSGQSFGMGTNENITNRMIVTCTISCVKSNGLPKR